jgi:hypothetical protein
MKISKRLHLIAFIAFVLVACELPPTLTVTPNPTPDATETPTATQTSAPDTATPTSTDVWPTLTPLPTETATETSSPTPDIPTPIVPVETVSPDAPNLLPCPEMECEFSTHWECDEIYGCVEHSVPDGAFPFYRDQPYTPDKQPVLRPCAEGQEWGCNPPELFMGRPEYKPTETEENEDGVRVSVFPYRVHSGIQAAAWFCMFRSCQAGLYYVVNTEPGMLCEAGGYIQSWSSPDGSLQSQLITQDDRDASQWRIKVNKSGKTFAFLGENLSSRWYNWEDGHYDNYVKMFYQFTANSYQTTVFFENLRIWRFGNQDSYLDSVYLRCNPP